MTTVGIKSMEGSKHFFRRRFLSTPDWYVDAQLEARIRGPMFGGAGKIDYYKVKMAFPLMKGEVLGNQGRRVMHRGDD